MGFCAVCVRRAPPPGFARAGAVDAHAAADASNAARRARAEGLAAARWEGEAPVLHGGMSGGVAIGAGEVGAGPGPSPSLVAAAAAAPIDARRRRRRRRRARRRRRRRRRRARRARRRRARALSTRSAGALRAFERRDDEAAADVPMAHALLQRAAELDVAARSEAVAAVGAGDLATAAQLALGGGGGGGGGGPARDAAEGGDGAREEPCPLCYEPLAEADGGAVGCLRGHRLHAACAADLALGGEACPTCREPLFFARVGAREAAAALAALAAAERGRRPRATTRAAARATARGARL